VKRLLIVTLLLAGGAIARADESSLLEDANKDYADQHYEAAVAKYEQVLRKVQHEDIYYNLGNAYFRLAEKGQPNDLGRAILSYERALVLDPGFEDARFNLDVARELVGTRYGADKVKDADRDPFWIRVVTVLPLKTLAFVFLIFDVLFFGVLIVIRFLPTGFLRTGLVVGNVFAGLAGLAFGILLLGHVVFRETVHVGVVVSDEVTMHEKHDPASREGPKLHAGHRAVIVSEDRDSGWLFIRLANNMEGWVPKEAMEQI
jgi:hypothetical protein